MAVSGKTSNLEIPYFLGTDKPPDMAAVTKAMAEKLDDFGLGLAGRWRTILSVSQPLASALASSPTTPYICGTGATPKKPTENLSLTAPPMMTFLASDHALPGMATKVRLKYSLLTDATALGTTLKLGLVRAGSAQGAGGALTMNSTAFINFKELISPASSSLITGASAEGEASELGEGILFFGFTLSEALASNAAALLGLELQVRNV